MSAYIFLKKFHFLQAEKLKNTKKDGNYRICEMYFYYGNCCEGNTGTTAQGCKLIYLEEWEEKIYLCRVGMARPTGLAPMKTVQLKGIAETAHKLELVDYDYCRGKPLVSYLVYLLVNPGHGDCVSRVSNRLGGLCQIILTSRIPPLLFAQAGYRQPSVDQSEMIAAVNPSLYFQ
jgi:hypothetical protein